SSRAAVPISSTLAFPSDQVVWQWRSPRICPSSTSGGGGPAGSPSRSSGGANGRPSAANTPASSAASGSGSSAPTHSADPVARTSAVPNDEAGATTSSTGVPSTVTPRWGGDERDDLRQGRERPSHRLRVVGGDRDREPARAVAPATRVAGGDAAERVRDTLDERPRARQQQRACRGVIAALQCGENPRLRLGADAGRLAQPAGGRGGAELRGRPHAQRLPDLRRPPRAEPEQPPERGELRRDGALELAQLREPAGLDELAQPALDSGPDPAQLAHAPRTHELRDRRRCRPDQLGCAAVRSVR